MFTGVLVFLLAVFGAEQRLSRRWAFRAFFFSGGKQLSAAAGKKTNLLHEVKHLNSVNFDVIRALALSLYGISSGDKFALSLF